MARYAFIVLCAILFAGCAEVGTISGGPEDEFAPRPIEARCTPQNGAVNFTGKEIELAFDEFFQLSDPSSNIRIVPPHAKITARMKGKSLFLNWEETLEPNTTYAIYLNNAVKDITEGNDSIIQYVFSTGAALDTLRYTTAIADAWTGKPVKGCTVGLFDPESGELQSFTESDRSGIAQFSYLRPGEYWLAAFIDENKDLDLQPDEALAFPESEKITIRAGLEFDSIPLRLFVPKREAKIRTVRPEFPGVLTLAAEEGLAGAEFFVNGSPLAPEQLRWLGPDSVLTQLYFPSEDALEFVVHSALLHDTLLVRGKESDRNKRPVLRPELSSGKYSPADSLLFWCSDWISGVDTSLISVLNKSDSSRVNYSLSFEHNVLQVHLPTRRNLESVHINLLPGAVKTVHGETAQHSFALNLQSVRKYGSLALDLSAYDSPLVVQVQLSGKTVRNLRIENPSLPVKVELLEPGDYTFVLIRDANANGKWDVGNYRLKQQPELVDRYSEVIKVRANWEVETALIPNASP